MKKLISWICAAALTVAALSTSAAATEYVACNHCDTQHPLSCGGIDSDESGKNHTDMDFSGSTSVFIQRKIITLWRAAHRPELFMALTIFTRQVVTTMMMLERVFAVERTGYSGAYDT